MAEKTDLQLVGARTEGLQPSIERAVTEVEIPNITPVQTVEPTVLEPLVTHKVGTQVQKALDEGLIGLDTPDLSASTLEANTWLAFLQNKKLGAKLPN